MVAEDLQISAEERRKASDFHLVQNDPPTSNAQTRFNATKSNVHEHGLNTVCEEARCPNIHDCWGRGTATFMIAGGARGCNSVQLAPRKRPLL